MAGRLDEPLEFGYDEDFERDLRQIKREDGSTAERIVAYCEEIRKNPFKGEWKQYAMDGLYGLHVEELVLLYQLQPNVSPNNSPNDVDEVYFCRVVHHDDQQTAVTNVDRAERTIYVSLRLEYERVANVQKYVNKLYETDVFRFQDDSYDSEGVSITGELVNDSEGRNREILESLLPEETIIEYDEGGFSQFV